MEPARVTATADAESLPTLNMGTPGVRVLGNRNCLFLWGGRLSSIANHERCRVFRAGCYCRDGFCGPADTTTTAADAIRSLSSDSSLMTYRPGADGAVSVTTENALPLAGALRSSFRYFQSSSARGCVVVDDMTRRSFRFAGPFSTVTVIVPPTVTVDALTVSVACVVVTGAAAIRLRAVSVRRSPVAVAAGAGTAVASEVSGARIASAAALR